MRIKKKSKIIIICTLFLSALFLIIIFKNWYSNNYEFLKEDGFNFVREYYEKEFITNGEKYNDELSEVAKKIIEETRTMNFEFDNMSFEERDNFYKDLQDKLQNEGESEEIIFKKMKCKINHINLNGIVEFTFRDYHSRHYEYVYFSDSVNKPEDGEQQRLGYDVFEFKKISEDVYSCRTFNVGI